MLPCANGQYRCKYKIQSMYVCKLLCVCVDVCNDVVWCGVCWLPQYCAFVFKHFSLIQYITSSICLLYSHSLPPLRERNCRLHTLNFCVLNADVILKHEQHGIRSVNLMFVLYCSSFILSFFLFLSLQTLLFYKKKNLYFFLINFDHFERNFE